MHTYIGTSIHTGRLTELNRRASKPHHTTKKDTYLQYILAQLPTRHTAHDRYPIARKRPVDCKHTDRQSQPPELQPSFLATTINFPRATPQNRFNTPARAACPSAQKHGGESAPPGQQQPGKAHFRPRLPRAPWPRCRCRHNPLLHSWYVVVAVVVVCVCGHGDGRGGAVPRRAFLC